MRRSSTAAAKFIRHETKARSVNKQPFSQKEKWSNQKSPKQKWKRVLITVAILWNAAAIVLGSTNLGMPKATQDFFWPYLWWTRIKQDWLLFVPTPRTFAIKYRVDIQFRDNTRLSWQRPYPPNWGFFERHLGYHFQRWDLASNRIDVNRSVQRDLANYLLRKYWSENNPPEMIKIIRMQADWPPPNPTGYVGGHDESILRWHDKLVERFIVKDGKLQ